MNTVIYQFEYPRPDKVSDKVHFFLDQCIESIQEYAERHGYDYKLFTEFTPEFGELWKDYSTDITHFDGRGWRYHYGWVSHLKDLAFQYDNIIKMDTDVYAMKPEIEFPHLDKSGFVTHDRPNKFGTDKFNHNTGVIKLDKQTALLYYEWTMKNLNREEADQFNTQRFLIDNPECFNPILDRKFNCTPGRDKEFPDVVFYHAAGIPDETKYDALCTTLEKYT